MLLRQPFLDAARVMLDEGLATHQDWLIMRRASSGTDCLSASVAEAAKLSVEERRDGRGPVFRFLEALRQCQLGCRDG